MTTDDARRTAREGRVPTGEAEREARTWSGAGEDVLRERAIRQLKKRRDFYGHLLVYVLVNAFLVVIWAITDLHGFFWPVFPIVGWGIAVVLNAWDVYRREEFTEEQIRRQVRHLQGSR